MGPRIREDNGRGWRGWGLRLGGEDVLVEDSAA